MAAAENRRAVDDILWGDPSGHRFGPEDRYEIVRKIGEGGMGMVFECFDTEKNRRIALKILKPDTGNETEILQRFRREGSRFAKLRHPNIVTVYGMGRDKGLLYIASEFIDGQNLHSWRKANGEYGVDRALEITQEVARGLQLAHDNGVVHRDLKPENIMLLPGGEVKILDFGIAKDLNASMALTLRGTYIGTPGYSSPEQNNGEDVDGRSDIFSLGVILYELITGEQAFSGAKTTDVIKATNTKNPLKIGTAKDMASPIVGVLDKMLAKKPRHRYQCCNDVCSGIGQAREWMVSGYTEQERPGLISRLRDIFNI